MRIIGAHRRAQDLRRAANRLRAELEPGAQRPAYDLVSAAGEIAETLAIIRHCTRLLDEAALPPEIREEFTRLLAFYDEYHKVMR